MIKYSNTWVEAWFRESALGRQRWNFYSSHNWSCMSHGSKKTPTYLYKSFCNQPPSHFNSHIDWSSAGGRCLSSMGSDSCLFLWSSSPYPMQNCPMLATGRISASDKTTCHHRSYLRKKKKIKIKKVVLSGSSYRDMEESKSDSARIELEEGRWWFPVEGVSKMKCSSEMLEVKGSFTYRISVRTLLMKAHCLPLSSRTWQYSLDTHQLLGETTKTQCNLKEVKKKKRDRGKETQKIFFHSNVKIQRYPWVQVRAEESLKYLAFS